VDKWRTDEWLGTQLSSL